MSELPSEQMTAASGYKTIKEAQCESENKEKIELTKSQSLSKQPSLASSSSYKTNANVINKKMIYSHCSNELNEKGVKEQENKQMMEHTSEQLAKLEAEEFAPTLSRRSKFWSFLCCTSNVSDVADNAKEESNKNYHLSQLEMNSKEEDKHWEISKNVPSQNASQPTSSRMAITEHQDVRQHSVQHIDNKHNKEECTNHKGKEALHNITEPQNCLENEYFISDEELLRPMKRNTSVVKDAIKLRDKCKSEYKEHTTEKELYMEEAKSIKTNENNENVNDKKSVNRSNSAECLTREERNNLLNRQEQKVCGTSQQISLGNNKRVSVISQLIKSTSGIDNNHNTKNTTRNLNGKSVASIIMEMDENSSNREINKNFFGEGANLPQSKSHHALQDVKAGNKQLELSHLTKDRNNNNNDSNKNQYYKPFTNATLAQIRAESIPSEVNNNIIRAPERRKNRSASATNLHSQITNVKADSDVKLTESVNKGEMATSSAHTLNKVEQKSNKVIIETDNKDGKVKREKTPWSSWREEESVDNFYDVDKVNNKETSKRSPSLCKSTERQCYLSLSSSLPPRYLTELTKELLEEQGTQEEEQQQQQLSTKANITHRTAPLGKSNLTVVNGDRPDQENEKLTFNNKLVSSTTNSESKNTVNKNIKVDSSNMVNDYTWKRHMSLESNEIDSTQRRLSAFSHQKDWNKTDVSLEAQNSITKTEETRSSSDAEDEKKMKESTRSNDLIYTKESTTTSSSSSTWSTRNKSVSVLEDDNNTVTNLPSFGVNAHQSHSMSESSPSVAPCANSICKSDENANNTSKDSNEKKKEMDRKEQEKIKSSVNGTSNKEVISSSLELALSHSLNNSSANGITSSSLNSRKSVLTCGSTWPAVYSSTLSAINMPSSILTSSHHFHRISENLHEENNTQRDHVYGGEDDDDDDSVNLGHDNNIINDDDGNKISINTITSTTEMPVPRTNKINKKINAGENVNVNETSNDNVNKNENRKRKRMNSVENEVEVLTRYLLYPRLNLCMSTFTDIGGVLRQSKLLEFLDLRGSTLSSESLRGLGNITTLHTVYLSNMKYLTSLLPLVTPAECEENVCSITYHSNNYNNNNSSDDKSLKNNNKLKRCDNDKKAHQCVSSEDSNHYAKEKKNNKMNEMKTNNKVNNVCSLVEIDAHCTSLTNSGIDGISPFLPYLQILDLSMNKITSVNCLRHCHGLRELSLAVTLVNSDGIVGLEELPHLVYLNLARTRVTSLHQLCSSKSLQTLIVHSCAIYNEDIIGLPSMPSLRQLDVSTTKITNLSSLGSSKSLQVIKAQWLSLKNCFDIIQQRRVMGNEKLCALESLIPNAVREVGYAGLANIRTLIALDLSFNPIRSIESLCTCPSLKHLILHRTRINSSGVKRIGALSRTLQTLIITNLTDYAEDADDEENKNEQYEEELLSSEKPGEQHQNQEEEEQCVEEELEDEMPSLLKLQWPSPSEQEPEEEEEEEEENKIHKEENFSCNHSRDYIDFFGLDSYQRCNRTDTSKALAHNNQNNNINNGKAANNTNKQINNNEGKEKSKTVNYNSLHDNGLLSSIDAIASLTTLTTLDLSYTDVYDLRLLEHMKVLRELILIETLITVDGLRGIEKIPTLELLDLSQTSVMTLSFLCTGAAELKCIIAKSNRNEAGFTLGPITQLPSLEHLDLSDTVVEDAHLLFGKSNMCNNNNSNNNSDNNYNKKEEKNFAWSLKSLTWRWHERCEATGSVQALPCCVKSSTLVNLSHVCPLLVKLDVSKTNIHHLNFLKHVKQLKWLNVSGCTHLHNSALESLVDITNLQKLSLTGVKHINNVNCLSTLTQLKEIRLNRTSVTLTGLRHVIMLPSLRVCHLSGTPAESEFTMLMSGTKIVGKLSSTKECKAVEWKSNKNTKRCANVEKGNSNQNKTKELSIIVSNNNKIRNKSKDNIPILCSSSSISSSSSEETSCLSSSCATPMTPHLTSMHAKEKARQNMSADFVSDNNNHKKSQAKENNITDVLTPSELDLLLSCVYWLTLKIPGRHSHHYQHYNGTSCLDVHNSKRSKKDDVKKNLYISDNSDNYNANVKHNGQKHHNNDQTNWHNSLEEVPSFFDISCFSQTSSKSESLPFTALSPILQTITSTETKNSNYKKNLESVQSLEEEEEKYEEQENLSLLPVFSSYYETLENCTKTNSTSTTKTKKEINGKNSKMEDDYCNTDAELSQKNNNNNYSSNKEMNAYTNDISCAKRHLFSLSINHHLRMNSSLAEMSCGSIDNTNSSNSNHNNNEDDEVNNNTTNDKLNKNDKVTEQKNKNYNKCDIINLSNGNVNMLEECVTFAPLEFCIPPPTRVSFVGVDDEVDANAGAIMRKVNEQRNINPLINYVN